MYVNTKLVSSTVMVGNIARCVSYHMMGLNRISMKNINHIIRSYNIILAEKHRCNVDGSDLVSIVCSTYPNIIGLVPKYVVNMLYSSNLGYKMFVSTCD